jgi:hypothetical protein
LTKLLEWRRELEQQQYMLWMKMWKMEGTLEMKVLLVLYICCKEQTKNCDILQGKCQGINPLVKELLTWWLGTREIGADKGRKKAGFLILAHWHPWAIIANHESWTNWSELYIWVGMSRGMFCSCVKYLTNWNLCVCELLQARMWGSICFSNKKFPRIQ